MSENNTDSTGSSLPEDAKAKLAAALGGSTGSKQDRNADDTGSSKSNDDSAGQSGKPQDVLSVLSRIIEDATGLPLEEITPKSRFDSDLNVDSLSKIDIAVQAEDRFGVRIEEEDLAGKTTVKDLAAFIEKNQTDK